jgi:hypothetical protein
LKSIDRKVIYRLTASILLASAAGLLFILNRQENKMPEDLQQEFDLSVREIDREVDNILENFGIERTWIQRKEIAGIDDGFTRIERRVLIPPTIIPVLINREFNLLAKRFHGKAVATENLRENSVTIHIVLHQSVIQTIILKTHQDIRSKGIREQRKNV